SRAQMSKCGPPVCRGQTGTPLRPTDRSPGPPPATVVRRAGRGNPIAPERTAAFHVLPLREIATSGEAGSRNQTSDGCGDNQMNEQQTGSWTDMGSEAAEDTALPWTDGRSNAPDDGGGIYVPVGTNAW